MRIPSLVLLTLLPLASEARDLQADIAQAAKANRESQQLLLRNEFQAIWQEDGDTLIFRTNTAPKTHEYFEVDLESGKSRKLEADDELKEKLSVSASLVAPEELRDLRVRGSGQTNITIHNETGDGIEVFWVQDGGGRKSYARVADGESFSTGTYVGHRWLVTDSEGKPLAGLAGEPAPTVATIKGRVKPKPGAERPQPGVSPDGSWKAVIQEHNLFLKPTKGGDPVPLTTDGTEAAPYRGPFRWSPDSSRLVAFHQPKVNIRKVHFVEAAPKGQLQPKLHTIDYNKPGDPIAQRKPRLFDVGKRKQIDLDDSLYDNPWSINALHWSADSQIFFFAYNQRGHQVMRIVGVNAANGDNRTLFEDTSETFIDYSQKFHLTHLPETREILWTSERDGYNHLYLINERTGAVESQITRGEWNVREIVEIDEEKRRVLIRTMGLNSESPYYSDFAWVGFDGTGFTRLTHSKGNHSIEFSPDKRHFIATWSRSDQPPVRELRLSEDGSLVAELNRADDSALLETGWTRPERFVHPGRDGETEIHGIIIRPRNFDPTAKYPVVENIYAGPHDFFTPQTFQASSRLQTYADLGFIIVKMDGMGTNWRSKKFHDVCWKNLADSGFPDRKIWIRAAAESRPWMDLERVGIYGGSAGGQSSVSAVLHHGEFYKVAVADCGCHDNRVDKIWWNEAWMGWPIDDSYKESSNVTHAGNLEGDLLLIYGEVDRNVDPASTTQVAAALQKANKFFELMPIMGAGHGAAETPYGNFRRAEFLVRHLNPPSPDDSGS